MEIQFYLFLIYSRQHFALLFLKNENLLILLTIEEFFICVQIKNLMKLQTN